MPWHLHQSSPGAAAGLGDCRVFAGAEHEGGEPSSFPGLWRRKPQWCAAGGGHRSLGGPWNKPRAAGLLRPAGRSSRGSGQAAARSWGRWSGAPTGRSCGWRGRGSPGVAGWRERDEVQDSVWSLYKGEKGQVNRETPQPFPVPYHLRCFQGWMGPTCPVLIHKVGTENNPCFLGSEEDQMRSGAWKQAFASLIAPYKCYFLLLLSLYISLQTI